jgi:TP901 family phage tail tape measure protein
MSEDLGSAHGSIVINAASALATLAALRRSSAATVGSLNTVGRASITGGTGIAAVGVGIGAVFALAVKKSAQLEKQISYIKGITGIHGKEVDTLRDKIIQLGQDSAYTAGEVADGFTELTKAGATTEQLIGGVGDAMITLGQSADISLTDAATSLVSISSTFGIAAKDAAKIADTLQGAANASIISVEDMSVSFKYAGGVAANLGLSFRDTATAIAILGNAGIKGSTAGTSLRRILLQLTPRTTAAKAEMKALGIITEDGSNKFYTAAGNAKSLSKITEILRKSTEGLTAEMKQKAFATIFGDRAINSAIALSKGGGKAFDDMYKKVGNVKAADVAAERLNNLAGKWEILKGTIDSALIRAGAPAQKPLMEIVVLVTKLVNAFNSLSPGTQAMIVRFALITGALFLLVGGFLIIVGTIFRAAAVFMQLANVVKIVSMQMKLFIAVQRAANGAMLFSPWTLLIVAIIALVVAIVYAYKHSERFRKLVQKVGGAIKDAAMAVWNFLKKVPAAVVAAWNAVSGFFTGMYNAVAGFISGAINFIRNNWEKILLVILTGPLGLAIVLFLKFKDQIIGAVRAAVSGALNFLKQLPARIGFILGFVIGSVIRFSFLFVKWLVQSAVKATVAFIGFLVALPGRMWGIFVAAIAFTVRFSVWLIAKAIAIGKGFLNGLINFFKLLPGRIWGFFLMVMQKAEQFRNNVIAKAKAIGKGILDGIVNGITGLPGLVWNILQNVIGTFKSMIKTAFNAAKGFAGGLWNGFKKGLGINSPSLIEKQMVQITDVTGDSTKTLKGQIRTLQRVGASLPLSDYASSSSDRSARSLPMRDGQSSSAASRTLNQTININNPAQQLPTRSYDRAMKETAYVNGWSK